MLLMYTHTRAVFNTVQKCLMGCFNTDTAVGVGAAEIRIKYAAISEHRDSLVILFRDSLGDVLCNRCSQYLKGHNERLEDPKHTAVYHSV